MHRSVFTVATAVLAVVGLAGCSADAVADRLDEAVADRLDTILPGGLDAVCESYRSLDEDVLVDQLRGQFVGADLSELLGLPVHVDNDRLLQVIADQVSSACG